MLCRLIQNSEEGCDECTADAAVGWMDVSEMKDIGDRECGDWCKCDVEFEDEVNLRDEDIQVQIEIDSDEPASAQSIDADAVNKMPDAGQYLKSKEGTAAVYNRPGVSELLDEDAVNVIHNYTGGGYHLANNVDNQAEAWARTFRDNHEELVKRYRDNLEVSLNKLPSFEGTVFRGEPDPGGATLDMFKSIKGQTFTPSNFLSTTRAEYVVDDFRMGKSSIKYNIKLKAGGRGKDISIMSEHQREAEVLINRGTTFRVTKVAGKNVYLEEI